MLQSPQFTKIISTQQLYQFVMEGLFTHFFPDTNDPGAVYNKEDIVFFLTCANEPNKLKGYIQQDDQSKNLISLSKFKYHLDRILCKGWSKNGTVAKPLIFYKSEVNNYFSIYLYHLCISLVQICICVGETILSYCPGTNLDHYIPLYLQQTTTDQVVYLVVACW